VPSGPLAARAKGGHIFHIIKGRLGYRKMRYHGRAKTAARMSSLLALANLYLERQQLRAKSV